MTERYHHSVGEEKGGLNSWKNVGSENVRGSVLHSQRDNIMQYLVSLLGVWNDQKRVRSSTTDCKLSRMGRLETGD